LIIAFEEGYISQVDYTKAIEILERFLRLINGYINYLKRAKKSNDGDL